MVSAQRTPAVPVAELPGTLPPDTLPIEPDLDAVSAAAESHLQNASLRSYAADAVWRDFLSLTDSIRTIAGGPRIAETWTELTSRHQLRHIRTEPPVIQRLAPRTAWVDVGFTFHTCGAMPRICAGIASLILGVSGGWEIWMLRTWLESFEGQGNPDTLEPIDGTNIANGTLAEQHEVSTVVIGAGQNGLAIAGRLQALGLSYICLERNAEIGANWTGRYSAMRWNTPKEFGNLPFGRTYDASDPEWLSAEHIAKAFKGYVSKFGIKNVWLSSNMLDCSWDSSRKAWSIQLIRDDSSHAITCKHLVLAIGQGQSVPSMPTWPHKKRYRGDVLHALDSYVSAKPWSGKNGIVVGTANTAQDIALDMLDAGMSVTMVQRGKTLVIRSEWAANAMKPLYNTHFPTETADRIGFTWPTKLIRDLTNAHMHQLTEDDSEHFDALECAGFKVDRPGDLIGNLNERFGGYYFDFGACAKIEDGTIKMKSNAPPLEFTEHGVKFEDGEVIEADVVVFATGFQADHRKQIAQVVGEDVADQLDEYWGLDAEGELRGAYKPCGHPNLWLMGGDTRQARFFSRFVALQIQAAVLDHSMQPYLEE